MAAPFGNRNAEKWSFKKAVKLFNAALELTKKKDITTYKQGEKTIEVNAYTFDFIGEVARELGTFHHIFDHLIKRFPSLKRVHNQIINNLEANCYYNAKKGNIKEATAIVNLKSNHQWTDRQIVDSNIHISTIVQDEKTADLINKLSDAND